MTNTQIKNMAKLRNKLAAEYLGCKWSQSVVMQEEYELSYLAKKYGYQVAKNFIKAHNLVLAKRSLNNQFEKAQDVLFNAA